MAIAFVVLALLAVPSATVAGRGAIRPLPSEVAAEMDRQGAEALRRGPLPLDPRQILAEMEPGPPVIPAEAAARNRLSAAFGRLAGGPAGLFDAGLRDLAAQRLDDAAEAFTELRTSHPEAPQADDAPFWLAEIARRRGKPEEALAFLRLTRGALRQEAAWRLVWLLEDRGRSEEARALAERVSQESGSLHAGDALCWLGLRAQLRGDAATAVDHLEKVLALPASGDPGLGSRGPFLLPLALARRDVGNLAGAEQALLRFLLDRPDHPLVPQTRLALGFVLLEAAKPREAVHHLSWLLEAAPDEELATRARYGRLRAFLAAGDEAKAAVAYADLPAQGSWSELARLNLAWAAYRRGDPEGALSWLDRPRAVPGAAASAVPSHEAFLRGACLAASGRAAEAGRAFAQVTEGDPLKPAALQGAALAALDSGSPTEAADLLEGLIGRYPDYSERDAAWLALGEARLALGQVEKARRAFSTVAQGGPSYPEALYRRGWIALQSERWDEAVALFGRLVRDYPDDANREKALLSLARAEFNRQSVAPALKVLDELDAGEASPGSRAAGRFSRAWMLARSGQEDQARPLLEAVFAEDPRGPYAARALHTLAWLDLQRGDCAAALPRLEAAIALSPGGDLEREARTKRADCLYELARFSDALEAYRALHEDSAARFGEALTLGKLGRLDELERVAALVGARPEAESRRRASDLFRVLGQGRAAGGQAASAAAAYSRAADLSEPGEEADRARLEAARNFFAAGDDVQGLAALEVAGTGTSSAGTEALREFAHRLEVAGRLSDAAAAWDRLAGRSEGAARSRGLRAAARLRGNLGDLEGAAERLKSGIDASPSRETELRRALLSDLGELYLKAGRPDEARGPLERAAGGGLGAEGLRALVLLSHAQKASGRSEEALETYLRIGYLYPPADRVAAQALLEAAAFLEQAHRPDRARGVYQILAREAPEEWAAQARRRLEVLPPLPGP